MSKIHQLILVNEDIKKRAQKEFNKTEADIKQDIQILNEWWAKQPHLPQEKDDANTERLLMRNKFRIEQTKKKIDAYYTLRGMYPEFLGCTDFGANSKISTLLKSCYFFPLKGPSNKGERIFFNVFKSPENACYFSALELYQYCIMSMEIVNRIDYCTTTRFVVDTTNFVFAIYKKLDPIVVYKGLKLIQEMLSCRLSGIDYIYPPAFVDFLAKMVNPVMKEGRLNTHSSVDSLKKILDVEMLPNEYGGNAGTLDELQNAWTAEIVAQKPFLEKLHKCVSDESKRIGKSLYDENMFGAEGTFKQLNLD